MKLSNMLLPSCIAISCLIFTGCDSQNSQDVSTSKITTTESVSVGDTTKTSTEVELPVYTVATVSTYSPFATKTEDGTITGFDIDVLEAIGEAEGFKPEFVVRPWDGWKNDFEQGAVHIWAGGIAAKEERKKYIAFTDSYLEYETVVLTLADAQYSNLTAEKISMLKLGAEVDTADFELMQSLVGDAAHAKGFKSNYMAFEKLLQKDIDGIVGTKLVLASIAQQYDEFPFQFTILDDDSESKKLAFMLSKNDAQLQQKLNNGLKTIKKNGKLAKIEEKWFGNLLT